MATVSMLKRPESVIRLSPTSGVFGDSRYIGDEEGFCAKILCQWYKQPNNTMTLETPQHIEAARQLFPFYTRYREAVDAGTLLGGAAILKSLYDTGSTESAEALLSNGR